MNDPITFDIDDLRRFQNYLKGDDWTFFEETYVKDGKVTFRYDNAMGWFYVKANDGQDDAVHEEIKPVKPTTPEEFAEGTKNHSIFQLSAPWNNPYQGDATRLVFVCSAGILRSATGATVYSRKGYNTRNCGTHSYALVPLNVNLIMWAHQIIFVNEENYKNALEKFETSGYIDELKEKAIVLNIPDKYDYMHPMLVEHFKEQLDPVIAAPRQSKGQYGSY